MRGAALLVLALALSLPALAADAPPPVPDGWSRAEDGTYTHTQSAVICKPDMGGYSFVRFEGPSGPGLLGVCVYSGGPVRVGKIRVRKFVDGAGDTPLAIYNDRVLMGVIPAANMPPDGKMISAVRGGPGPRIDGTDTKQLVITSIAGGLLVDCISQSARDAPGSGLDDFLKACMPGH